MRLVTAVYCSVLLGWMLAIPLIQKLYGDEVVLATLAIVVITGGGIAGLWWQKGVK